MTWSEIFSLFLIVKERKSSSFISSVDIFSIFDAGGAFEIRLLSATGPSALRTGQIQTADFKLYSNYPNPFNPDTIIRFLLPETCTVQLSIYDMTGKRVATPVHDELEPGFHTVNFHVGGLASGVYFCLLKTSDFSSIRKMVLVK